VIGHRRILLARAIDEVTCSSGLHGNISEGANDHASWPAHARFHGVTSLAMVTTLSSAGIWSIWSDQSDAGTASFYAAAVPVAYWAPFFLAPLVPGTAVDDPPHPVPRMAGLPTNLLGAAATTATAAAGWFLERRSSGSEADDHVGPGF
jgi:hypothetical protein